MEQVTTATYHPHKLGLRDRAVLLQTPFMHTMNGTAQARLMDTLTVVNVPLRNIVFREGDPAQYFYCVLSGYVRLYRLDRGGREADVRICAPGDTFAECLIYDGDTYRYHAQSAETATLARFDMRAVRELTEQDKDVARAVMTSLSRDLLSVIDCVADDRLRTAPQRVANYLLKRCPAEGGPASIRLPFQKSLLAGMLGLAPEALSRAFSTLRRNGVTVRGRVIQIGDVRALHDV